MHGLQVFFVEPLKDALRARRAAAEGDAAAADRARPRGLLPRQRLEHRRRGAVRRRRDRSAAASRCLPTARRRRWIAARDAARRRRSAAWLWAAIPALLRTRFNANEILVSLMLVYVAQLLLSLAGARAVEGSRGLQLSADEDVRRPALLPDLSKARASTSALPDRARRVDRAAALFLFRSFAGFQLQVAGLAPAAARYAGFSAQRTVWIGAAVRRRDGGPRGHGRSGRPARPAHRARVAGLRLRRDHRRLRRPAASGRHRLREPA